MSMPVRCQFNIIPTKIYSLQGGKPHGVFRCVIPAVFSQLQWVLCVYLSNTTIFISSVLSIITFGTTTCFGH
jgi:hypothetical protein